MSQDSRISSTFAGLKSENRMAFMPFLTAGDPDMAGTCGLIEELADRGVDLIEVGFPYSDPIADGPVIQASYTRALNSGLRVRDIFAGIGQLTKSRPANSPLPPLVAMVSYAIIFRYGVDDFLRDAAASGFAGLIVPDLPGDEASEFLPLARGAGLDLVQLVAPTTPPARVERILRSCSGFVYCIAVAGTTGERESLPDELRAHLQSLKEKTELPLAVGFGISRPEQVDVLRGLADGVIIGSAIVRQLEGLAESRNSFDETRRNIGELAAGMVAATRSAAT